MSELKYQLVEETGHSYSGICEIVREQNKSNELIIQLDEFYNDLKQQQEQLEKELEKVKCERGLLVNDFILLHKALKLNDKSLTYVINNQFTEVKILDENRINYEKYPITVKID